MIRTEDGYKIEFLDVLVDEDLTAAITTAKGFTAGNGKTEEETILLKP